MKYNTFLYRDHRGGLAESMSTIQEFKNKNELITYLRKELVCAGLPDFQSKFDLNDIKITHYMFDNRIKWDTYIVHLDGFGVLGFTNRPVR